MIWSIGIEIKVFFSFEEEIRDMLLTQNYALSLFKNFNH